ncbi:MAG TPA: serine protease [Verrucomicrobiae bacterium]|nr:serine protease [Verrucomicrobiae bacterium]
MTKFLVAGLSGALFLGSCASSGADEMAEKARAVFKKNQSSVVTIQLVVKSKMGFAGAGGDSRESKQEVSGTVIDPSGLTAVSLSSTDPTSLLQGFMSGFGGDGEDNFKFKMDSELSDVKLLSQDGTELPAEIVLRDKDLDLAFLRPKSKPATPLAAVDLGSSAKVEVLDEVITINRLGKVAGRAYAASIERISAVVQKPRLFYVPGTDKTATGLGCPAFTADGKVVGLFVMRAVKSGGGGASLFNMQSAITAILLPAEDVKKVAAQVPAAKEEQK